MEPNPLHLRKQAQGGAGSHSQSTEQAGGLDTVFGLAARSISYNILHVNSSVWVESLLFLKTPDLPRIWSKVVFQDLLSRIGPHGTAVGKKKKGGAIDYGWGREGVV